MEILEGPRIDEKHCYDTHGPVRVAARAPWAQSPQAVDGPPKGPWYQVHRRQIEMAPLTMPYSTAPGPNTVSDSVCRPRSYSMKEFE